MTKAVQFSNTFGYIDDSFHVNNEHFGHYINAIYPSELELKNTTLTPNEVCYLDTRIKTGDSSSSSSRLFMLVSTTRGLTSHFGLLIFVILTATSPQTRPTVLHTVPFKCKLTVSTQNSILDTLCFRQSSFEAQFSSFEYRVSSFEKTIYLSNT